MKRENINWDVIVGCALVAVVLVMCQKNETVKSDSDQTKPTRESALPTNGPVNTSVTHACDAYWDGWTFVLGKPPAGFVVYKFSYYDKDELNLAIPNDLSEELTSDLLPNHEPRLGQGRFGQFFEPSRLIEIRDLCGLKNAN